MHGPALAIVRGCVAATASADSSLAGTSEPGLKPY
jgi:hypothetical protein